MRASYTLLSALTAVSCVAMVTCFPTGPPPTNYTCREMFPVGHGVNAQFSNPPYEIILSQNIYTTWELINVTINAAKGRTFRGFYLQARRANCAHPDRQIGLGVFQPKTRDIKPIDCVGGTKNAVSHSHKGNKTSITVLWSAPGAPVGHIYFVATVVDHQRVFWTNVYSDILRQHDSGEGASICPSRMLLDPSAKTTPKPDPEKQRSAAVRNSVSRTVLALVMLAVTITLIL